MNCKLQPNPQAGHPGNAGVAAADVHGAAEPQPARPALLCPVLRQGRGGYEDHLARPVSHCAARAAAGHHGWVGRPRVGGEEGGVAGCLPLGRAERHMHRLPGWLGLLHCVEEAARLQAT